MDASIIPTDGQGTSSESLSDVPEATQQVSLANSEPDTNQGRRDAHGRQSRKSREEGARRPPGGVLRRGGRGHPGWDCGSQAGRRRPPWGCSQAGWHRSPWVGLWFSGGVVSSLWTWEPQRLGPAQLLCSGSLGLQQRSGDQAPCSPSMHVLGL